MSSQTGSLASLDSLVIVNTAMMFVLMQDNEMHDRITDAKLDSIERKLDTLIGKVNAL
ncbi:MAG: hypothetical protein RR744_08330 [Cellulosilyticaceae bacterium]